MMSHPDVTNERDSLVEKALQHNGLNKKIMEPLPWTFLSHQMDHKPKQEEKYLIPLKICSSKLFST